MRRFLDRLYDAAGAAAAVCLASIAAVMLAQAAMREFGYLYTEDARSLIRLSCITPCNGAVSIVIPPWNGFFGKYLQKQQEETGAATGDAETQTESIA